MPCGYIGKILRVNLSNGKTSTEQVNDEIIAKYIGGRGLASKILYDEIKPHVDPFSRENKIIFTTGPLTGTPTPSCTKSLIVTKSPLTGLCLHTFASGLWGKELKHAGFDAVIVESMSSKPVYLWINNGKIQIRDGKKLWGLRTIETQKIIREEISTPDASVACIGPAGERLVRYACVISDTRAYGRGGSGAVMGSKNLKAIAVKGTGKIMVFDNEALNEALRDIMNNLKGRVKGKVSLEGLTRYGSTCSINVLNELGIFPTRNFQTGVFEEAEKISGEGLDEYVIKHTGCYGCPVRCWKLRLAKDGEAFFRGYLTDGPEYETVWSFGPQCGNEDPNSIIAADYLCDMFGLDTISAGNAIGFAMELYEKGIISKKDTDGTELRFGNRRAMIDMIRKITFRECGLGDMLAEGVRRASELIGKGAEKYAMHAKGMELPGYDVRGAQAHGLNYATATRGGCHERGFATQEVFGFPWRVDRFTVEGKAKLTIDNQNTTTVYDSMVVCVFASFMTGLPPYAKALAAVTGLHNLSDTENLLRIGERIWNIEKAFNTREGFAKKDDTLPDRMLKEPMPEGASQGHVVRLKPMLDEYYELRGWSKKTGLPTRSKLEDLDLQYIADDLEKLGLLGR